MLAGSKPLADTLYQEIIGRIKQDDATVPYLKRGYWYYSRFETGKDYAIIARRKGQNIPYIECADCSCVNDKPRARFRRHSGNISHQHAKRSRTQRVEPDEHV